LAEQAWEVRSVLSHSSEPSYIVLIWVDSHSHKHCLLAHSKRKRMRPRTSLR
jgi:hypothetical protein